MSLFRLIAQVVIDWFGLSCLLALVVLGFLELRFRVGEHRAHRETAISLAEYRDVSNVRRLERHEIATVSHIGRNNNGGAA